MIADIANQSDSESTPPVESFTSRANDNKIEEIFPVKDSKIAKLQQEEEYNKSEQIPAQRADLKLDFNINSSMEDTEKKLEDKTA